MLPEIGLGARLFLPEMWKYLCSAGALTIAISIAACGGIGNDSCNYVGTEPRCQERETKMGDPAASFKDACEASGAEYGGCPAGKLVGCVVSDDANTKLTDWYYPPLTRDEAVAMCASGNIVEP